MTADRMLKALQTDLGTDLRQAVCWQQPVRLAMHHIRLRSERTTLVEVI